MNKLTGPILAVVLAATVVRAQEPAHLFSHPQVPTEEALSRLNLALAWRIYVPLDGRQDGIFSVQVLKDLILVQTHSGGIIALDPADGSTRWRTRVGLRYRQLQPLGVNDTTVFAYNGGLLFGIDRKNGATIWEFAPRHAPTGGPVADGEHLFLPLNGARLDAFDLPRPGARPRPGPVANPAEPPVPSGTAPAPSGTPPSESPSNRPTEPSQPAVVAPEEPAAGPRFLEPLFVWTYEAEAAIERQPVLSRENVFVAEENGGMVGVAKETPREVFRLRADSRPSAGPGHYADVAYQPTEDFVMYAVDIHLGRLLWRFTAAGLMLQPPAVNDDDIYVSTSGAGVYRLSRRTGEELWRNPGAFRFLAANPRFVYAINRSGRLLVLDRQRGTTLSSCDARDFSFRVVNEVTDRVYLAAHDGLLICMHDRAYPTPLSMRAAEESAAAPPPTGPATPPHAAPPPSEQAPAPPPPSQPPPPQR
jgi:outer membrane protein assembly factor BamB